MVGIGQHRQGQVPQSFGPQAVGFAPVSQADLLVGGPTGGGSRGLILRLNVGIGGWCRSGGSIERREGDAGEQSEHGHLPIRWVRGRDGPGRPVRNVSVLMPSKYVLGASKSTACMQGSTRVRWRRLGRAGFEGLRKRPNSIHHGEEPR